jgi:hypothetical protein
METTDKENKKEKTLEWSHFQLPNIPIYQTKLPQDIVDRLWGYVDKAKEKNSNKKRARKRRRITKSTDTTLQRYDII